MQKKLNLFDAILFVTSGMIGSAIWIVAADMSRTVGGPGWMLLLWIIGGIMTIFAALSYGELAGMFPKAGGQYVYLKEAYNPMTSFLYGWTLFSVIQTGTIAAVGVGFAKFCGVLFPVVSEKNILLDIGFMKITAAQVLGVASVFLLTFINTLGINYGKWILRLFTSAKLLALFGLIILGLFFFKNNVIWENNLSGFWHYGSFSANDSGALTTSPLSSIGLIMALGVGLVGSLFAMDAWNNVGFIAGEINNPKKNIPKSLIYGTLIVVLIYILVNVAFLNLLPFQGNPAATDDIGRGIMFASKDRVGIAAAKQIFGESGVFVMAILIIISAIGCNNGLILSSARVYQTMANDNLFFSKMKQNNKNGVPAFALWMQFIWASILCLSGKYGDLLDYVIFAVVIFYILTIYGVIRLRKKQPLIDRPYKTLGYPFIPIIYIVLAALFCMNLIFNKPLYTFPGLVIVLIGIPVFFYWRNKQK